MRRAARALVLGLAVALAGCAGRYFQDAGPPPAPPQHRLADWPWQEYWTHIVFNGTKIGYAHVEVGPALGGGEAFEIAGDSAFRLRFMGFDKRIALRARDRVTADFALESFEYAYHIGGSDLALSGARRDGVLRVKVTNAGRTSEQTLSAPSAIYPASAVGMIPFVRGLVPGAEYRYTVYVGESQRLAEVQQRVESYERSTLFEREAWKVTTDLEGLRTTICRLRRVVFAAADPKTGAAGSVVDLFSNRLLNHHTELEGGVLTEPAAVLREFFGERRAQAGAERGAMAAADDAAPIPTGEVIESLPPDEPPAG